MRGVDTNVVLRIAVGDDSTQAEAADEFIVGGAWVSHVVLAEFAWALEKVYALGPAEIAAGIEMLLEHEHLVVQEPDIVREALEAFRRRPAVEFSDHLILEIARKAGHLPLGTFDRDLGKLEGATPL